MAASSERRPLTRPPAPHPCRRSLRLQAMQETAGAFGINGGGEYRPLVVLHDPPPVGDIAGIIGARLRRRTEIDGEERAA